MSWPNFLIVGAAKAGTTSVYHYLKQHPAIFMSERKEPAFFCFAGETVRYLDGDPQFITDPEDYQRLFQGGGSSPARGEATAIYLYFHHATIKNIFQYVPDPESVKIIIGLRNPVERAFSQYMMLVRDLREPLSFEEAIALEEGRKEDGYSSDFLYVSRGFYADSVRAYMEKFQCVKTFLYDDLRRDPGALCADLFSFLGVDPNVTICSDIMFNVSGRPRASVINRWMSSRGRAKMFVTGMMSAQLKESLKNAVYRLNLKRERINDDTRAMLGERYRDDVDQLSSLIGRDLSFWLKPPGKDLGAR